MSEEEIIQEITNDKEVEEVLRGSEFIQIQIEYTSWKGEAEIPNSVTKIMNLDNWNLTRIVGIKSKTDIIGLQLTKRGYNE